MPLGERLRRWAQYYVDLRGIYHLEKKRRKRGKMPGANIVKLDAKNNYQFFQVMHQAADCLKDGGIVAVPTDTLYGLCTLVENADRLYRLKKRPDEKPLGLFIAGAENVSEYAQQTVPNGLLKNLFPGPVTIVFNRTDKVPPQFNPNSASVGFRVPVCRFVGDLCRFLPYRLIAQTSANVSGTDKNPICIEDFKELWDEIDMIIDTGPIMVNNGSRLGSTVIDLTIPGQYRLLRAGCAELETIEVLREYGLKTPEEVERERLAATEQPKLKHLPAPSDHEEKLGEEERMSKKLATN